MYPNSVKIAKNLEGKRFGEWAVLYRYDTPGEAGPVLWMCRCSCGTEKPVLAHNLTSGSSKSCPTCGHDKAVTARRSHGMSGSPTYIVWSGMKARCLNPNNLAYPSYGGRGIRICDRWLESFENFLEDMGPRPPKATLERMDNDKGYSLDNCQWKSKKHQANNRRSNRLVTLPDGETITFTQACERHGITIKTLRYYTDLNNGDTSAGLKDALARKPYRIMVKTDSGQIPLKRFANIHNVNYLKIYRLVRIHKMDPDVALSHLLQNTKASKTTS